MPFAPLTGEYAATRTVARRVAAHIMARTRKAAVGRIDLAPFPGGFGTPSFGADHTVIRISGGWLIVERTGATVKTRSLPANVAPLTGSDRVLTVAPVRSTINHPPLIRITV